MALPDFLAFLSFALALCNARLALPRALWEAVRPAFAVAHALAVTVKLLVASPVLNDGSVARTSKV